MPLRRVARTAALHVTHGLDIWLGIGKFAKQTREYVYIYGFPGLFMPFLLSSDVFHLVQSILRREDDDQLFQRFAASQVQQVSMVAMIGSIIAGNAVSALSKELISSVPWPAAAFMNASLVAALFCVYHSMRLNRIVGALVTPDSIKHWLRSPPEKVRCRDKNRPSVSTVLILDTPRTLVTMASVSFVVGWSIYTLFVYIYGLDIAAGEQNSMNIMIFYSVSLWFAIAVYLKADIFDYYTDRDHTWLAVREMAFTVAGLFTGKNPEDHDEEDGYPLEVGPVIGPQSAPHRMQNVGEIQRAAVQNLIFRPVGVTTPSTQSERKSLGNALLAEALRESIEGRKKAIEGDEQFVRALEMYQPDMKDSYNS